MDILKNNLKTKNMENQNIDPIKIIIPKNVKHLMNIERTPEQEKELERALFGDGMRKFGDEYRWFTFLSLSKIRDTYFPTLGTIGMVYKEWIGETDKEIIVIRYTNAGIDIGVGRSEYLARMNVTNIGKSVLPDPNINMQKINEQLKLEWVLPGFYIDE